MASFKVPPFTIASPDDPTTDPMTIRMPVHPWRVDGVGWRTSTKTALAAVASNVTSGMSFADIGCGAGVLSVAACLLGARPVFALDLDDEAFEAARRTFQANPDIDVTLLKDTYPPQRVDLAIVTVGYRFDCSAVPADKVFTFNQKGEMVEWRSEPSG